MIDILGGISLPLIQSGALAAAGVALLGLKHWRTGATLIVVAGAWAWLCATPTFSLLLWHALADRYPPRPVRDYPGAAAIIVVGGSLRPRRLEQWSATTDPARSDPLGLAVALYRAGKAPVLVATGHYGMEPAARALVRVGIPRSALRLEPASRTTRQDSLYSLAALQNPGATPILLVTTGSHMPRTVATFRRQGFRVTAAPARPPPWVERDRPSLLPRRTALNRTEASLHEYIGLFYYRLRGWADW